ncbi:MAG: hypothetical protein QHH75_02845 [Bacillota bacterium]|nr:hypothetical protein [Bacillota bacterium]
MARAYPVSWKLFVVCLIVIAGGGIVAASTTGWFDIKGWVTKVPFLDRWAQEEAVGKKDPVSLAEENKLLRSRIGELEKEVKRLKEREVAFQQIQKELEESAAFKEEKLAQDQAKKEGYRALAAYYADMKPGAAVAILNNLNSEVVAEILQAMDKEQAGQILAAMEPVRAAELLEVIARNAAQAST